MVTSLVKPNEIAEHLRNRALVQAEINRPSTKIVPAPKVAKSAEEKLELKAAKQTFRENHGMSWDIKYRKKKVQRTK